MAVSERTCSVQNSSSDDDHSGPERKAVRMLSMVGVLCVPIVALFVVTGFQIHQQTVALADSENVLASVGRGVRMEKLVTLLQLERGMSALFVSSNRSALRMLAARRATDSQLAVVGGTFSEFRSYTEERPVASQLQLVRALVSGNRLAMVQVMSEYSRVIKSLIQWILRTLQTSRQTEIWPILLSANLQLRALDAIGEQRALASSFFSQCDFPNNSGRYFRELQGKATVLHDLVFLEKRFEDQPGANKTTAELEGIEASLERKERCLQLNAQERENITVQVFRGFSKYMEWLQDLKQRTLSLATRLVSDHMGSVRGELVTLSMMEGLILLSCLGLGSWYVHTIYMEANRIQTFTKTLHAQTQNIRCEQKMADSLLCELLPRNISERLKKGVQTDAEHFNSVTVFFSDIVSFTAIASHCTPMGVIDLLGALYSLFDNCISKYDVYKVTTIGDAYMVVSGLPVRNGNRHASEIACLSLDLIYQVATAVFSQVPNRKLQMRIGFHTGPCVAGVVGTEMPRYCVLGNVVFIASEMEATGQAQKIQISREAKRVLDQIGGFDISLRGELTSKILGTVQTYWLDGRKYQYNPDLQVTQPSEMLGTM